MKKGSLALLYGCLDTQLQSIERLWQEVQITQPTDREKTSHLAYLLHNLYCVFEDLFQAIVRTFENRMEDPSWFHRELLQRMQLVVPGFRVNVLSENSFLILNELRSFRHIFRHAYTYELDPERVRRLKLKVKRNRGLIRQDLDRFARFLTGRAREKIGPFEP
jgi:hypothetical protein